MKEAIYFLPTILGGSADYVIGIVMITIAFFYLANKLFSWKKSSFELRGKKLKEVKSVLDAVDTGKALLIEEAFFHCYGFQLQAKEVNYVLARVNPRSLIFDMKNARFLISYNQEIDGYEYKKRYSLQTRDRVQSSLYWVSAISAYITLILPIVTKNPAFIIFFPFFCITTFVSFFQIRNISSSKRILEGVRFPIKISEIM